MLARACTPKGWHVGVSSTLVGQTDPNKKVLTVPRPSTRAALHHFLCACYHAQLGRATQDAAWDEAASAWAERQMKKAHLAIPHERPPRSAQPVRQAG